MKPCLKRRTRCVIVRADGRCYEAVNQCNVDGFDVCPRVDLPSGERYDLCGCVHAEAAAAELAAESKEISGEAILYGHTWICKECQEALTAVNVSTFHISEEPA